MAEAAPPPVIELDRVALRANVARARQLCGDARLMVAVKSNAYGHGAELVVPEIVSAGVDELAVLDIDTALSLRPLVPDTPLFAWLHAPESDFGGAVAANVDLGVSTLWQLEAIRDCGAKKAATVHLKIDTGLHRNGATAEQWPELVERARELERAGLIRVRAVWSHLADTSRDTSLAALARLHDALEVAREAGLEPEMIHLAASHAAVELPECRLDMVRLGILAYGVSPFSDSRAEDHGFSPVLSVRVPVLEAQQRVVLGIGFGHGLIAPTSPDAEISLDGSRYRVLGVEVETTHVQAVGASPPLSAGDYVTLWGGDRGAVSTEEWAELANTIGDEILAHLDHSLTRRWRENPSDVGSDS